MITHEAARHAHKVFATAQDAIGRFRVAPESFTEVRHGQATMVRKGAERQVHYLELNDGSGTTLRVEVYVL